MSGRSDIDEHNQRVLESLSPGDRVEFSRGIYSHWGIYIGQGKVIHLAPQDASEIQANSESTHFNIGCKMYKKALVGTDDFLKVAGKYKAFRNNSLDMKLKYTSCRLCSCLMCAKVFYFRALSPETIVHQAMPKLGEVGYNFITANCEHFANWCRYGQRKSQQSAPGSTNPAFHDIRILQHYTI
ncbi:phospholipase A and acyltransferase 3-like [Biomphalaria glabrata]|uniref:Phospholipase A and acyltransferase 3-like n=1 Tax=Biomphalaria glabrata TaxID=6526 RepID=A0A9W3BCF9_BIOGL|nr:phospholipase A and acyltransferase 3-like [Biomphalaria glabrata]